MTLEKNILMTKTNYIKIKHLKNSYRVDKETTEKIDKNQYSRIVSFETLKWFRGLGGSETAQKSYTCEGYLTTRLISTSPDKTIKNIREFKFI